MRQNDSSKIRDVYLTCKRKSLHLMVSRVPVQVDVTSEEALGAGGLPAVDEQAVKAADPMSGLLNVAQRQLGAGWTTHDPWRAIKDGVAGSKPHKAQVPPPPPRRAGACPSLPALSAWSALLGSVCWAYGSE
jgi:hypothetical protein